MENEFRGTVIIFGRDAIRAAGRDCILKVKVGGIFIKGLVLLASSLTSFWFQLDGNEIGKHHWSCEMLVFQSLVAALICRSHCYDDSIDGKQTHTLRKNYAIICKCNGLYLCDHDDFSD